MTLSELATTDVVTASPDAELTELLSMMDEQDVGSVVITDGDEPHGIVTDRMIAMSFRDGGDIEGETAGDVMTEDIVTADEDDSHFDVMERMSEEGIRRIPIVSDGSLTGILTLDDLVMVTAAELGRMSDVIEMQTRASQPSH